MAEALSYRIYEPTDLDAVLQLWEQHSGWGGISELQFKSWYLETPEGSSMIIVAVNEANHVVGQTVFIPSKIYVGGEVIKAFRIAAPILDNSIRQKDLKRASAHPAFSMFRFGIQLAQEKGYELVYFFPAFAWTGVLKLLDNITQTTYDCFGISLEKPETFNPGLANKLTVKEVSGNKFTAEYDQLWQEAIHNFPIECGVVRNATAITWKLAEHLVFEIRQAETSQLKGYVAIKKKTGLIMDMLARTKEDSEMVFAAFVQAVHHSNPNKIHAEWKEIKGMYTQTFQSVLKNMHFEIQNFTFAFGFSSLESTTDQNFLQTDNWYLMPAD
jgi:hypothetical protein